MWKSMLFTMRIKGTFAEAKATLDSSLGMIERFNEHLWEAENHRVCGEVALDAGQFPEALTAFDRAIKVAGSIGIVPGAAGGELVYQALGHSRRPGEGSRPLGAHL
jgi:hypothetical protein